MARNPRNCPWCGSDIVGIEFPRAKFRSSTLFAVSPALVHDECSDEMGEPRGITARVFGEWMPSPKRATLVVENKDN